MELQMELMPDLWNQVKKNSEVGNYSGAILDGMLYLTEAIRNKAGLEGDGENLV